MLLVLLLSALAQDEVSLDVQTWLALRGEPTAPEVSPWLDPRPISRRVTLTPAADGWRLRATWTLIAPTPGWLAVRLASPEVAPTDLRLDGRPAPYVQADDGLRVALQLSGAHELVLEGLVPLQASPELLSSPEGRVDLPATWRLADAVWADGAWRTGVGRLTWAEEAASAATGTLATAQAALGVTVTDSELEVQARVTWRVRRGSLAALSLRVPGAGDDLTVDAPPGTRLDRQGDRLTLTPSSPVLTSTAVSLRWTRRLAGEDAQQVDLPRVEVDGVLRTERAITVARATELEVAPALRGGSPVAPTALPDWAAGLVRGTPVAARTGESSGRVDLLRFVPAEQPALIVDVADWIVAVSDEGRAVVQGTLTLRNETASHLLLRLPPGWSLAALQVDGVPANASPAGDAWRIALPRSVETVDGLLSFPVEIAAWGSFGAAWARAVEAELPLPAVSAPVAVRRVTLNLPRAWAPAGEHGEHGLVEDFTEGTGLAYGFGAGVDEGRATALYKDALQAWMENDFDRAQDQLDALREMGADNENVQRLQSNLTLVDETTVADAESTESIVARRVRGMAEARALDDQRAQADALQEVEEALESGDYEEAEKKLEEAQQYYSRLSRLEQKESYAQEIVREELKQRSEAVTKAKGEARNRDVSDNKPVDAPKVVMEQPDIDDAELLDASRGGWDGIPGETGGALVLDARRRDLSSVPLGGEPSFIPQGDDLPGWVPPEPTVEEPEPDVATTPESPEEPVVVDVPADAWEDKDDELETLDVVGGRSPARASATSGSARGVTRSGGGQAKKAPAASAPARGPATIAVAEEPPPPPPPPRPSPSARTEIDFSGELVEGQMMKPQGSLALDGDTGSIGGLGAQGMGAGGGGMAAAPAEPMWEPLQVSATSASLIVPVLGETVRYQHLLLDTDDDSPILIQARLSRRSP